MNIKWVLLFVDVAFRLLSNFRQRVPRLRGRRPPIAKRAGGHHADRG